MIFKKQLLLERCNPIPVKKWEKSFHSIPSDSTQRGPSILPLSVGGTFSCSGPLRQCDPKKPPGAEEAFHPLCTADAEACLASISFMSCPLGLIRDCLEIQTSNKISALNFKAKLAFSYCGCFHILAWLCHYNGD